MGNFGGITTRVIAAIASRGLPAKPVQEGQQ